MAGPRLTPVDYDPFAQPEERNRYRLTPVDFDPFARRQTPEDLSAEVAHRDIPVDEINAAGARVDYNQRRRALERQSANARDEGPRVTGFSGVRPTFETEEERTARVASGRAADAAMARETQNDPYGVGDDPHTTALLQHVPTGDDADPRRYPGLYRTTQVRPGQQRGTRYGDDYAGYQRLDQRQVIDTIVQNRNRVQGLNPDAAMAYLFGGARQRQQIDEARRGPLNVPTDQTGRNRQAIRERGAGVTPERNTLSPGDVDETPQLVDYSADAAEIRQGQAQRRQEARQRGDNIRAMLSRYDPQGIHSRAINSVARQFDEQRDPATLFRNSLEGLGGQFITGLSGVGESVGDILGSDTISNMAHTAATRGRQISAISNPGYAPDSLEYHLYNGINAVGQIGVTLAVGAATRNPAAVSAFLQSAQMYGDRYDQSRRDGRPVADSMLDATAYTVFEYIPERWSMGQIMARGGRFGSSFLGRVAKGSAVEAVQESATEMMQIAYDMDIIGEHMTWDQAWRRIKDSGIAGAIGGGTIAGAIHVGTGGHAGEQRREAIGEFEGTQFSDTGINRDATAALDPNGRDPGDPVNIESLRSRAGLVKPIPDNVTQGDIDSPLDTDLISKGKERIDAALSGAHVRGDPSRRNPALRTAPINEGDQPGRFAIAGGYMVGDGYGAHRGTHGTHHGVDMFARTGTPFQVGHDFEVVGSHRQAQAHDGRDGGNIAVVRIGNTEWMAMHLPNLPRAGRYRAGEPILMSGDSGSASAANPHIHWQPMNDAARAIYAQGRRAVATFLTGGQAPSGAVAGDGAVTDAAATPTEADTSWINAPVDQPESHAQAASATETRLPEPETVDVAGQPATVQERFDLNGEPGVRLQLHDGTTVEDTVARLAARGIRISDGSRAMPIQVTNSADIEHAASRAAQPTDAQAEAGNYRAGHIRLHGIDITIETPRGAERSGTGPDGERWSVTMPDHYGYAKRTTGADEEQVDVYVGPHPEARAVAVIDQIDLETGKFDEHKAMLGYSSLPEARRAYEAAFSDGRGAERIGGVQIMSMDEFKDWLASPQQKPASSVPIERGGDVVVSAAAEPSPVEQLPPSSDGTPRTNKDYRDQGRRAAEGGFSPDKNPYLPSSTANEQWAKGHTGAASSTPQQDALKAKMAEGRTETKAVVDLAVGDVVTAIDNSFGKGGARVVPLDNIPEIDHIGLDEKARATVQAAYDRGAIKRPTLRGTLGSGAEGLRRSPQAGSDSGSRGNRGEPEPERGSPQPLEAAKVSPNKVFTDDAADRARAILREKFKNISSNPVLDPELVQAGITLAGYHIEKGARSFIAYAKAMIADLGDVVRPHLRGWYEAVRYHPGMEEAAKEMSGPEEIGAAVARLEMGAESATPDSETKDADNAATSRPRNSDRAGDEGPGAGDVSGTEGGRPTGDRAEGPGDAGDGNLRAGDERNDIGSPEGQQESQPSGDRAGVDGGAVGSGRSRAGGSNRVRAKRAERGSNFLAPAGTLSRQGGWRATAERNLDIIELVNRLDAEGRPATPEEQALLAKFTGWGAGEIRNNLFRNIQRDRTTGERSISPYAYGDWKDTVERASKLLTGAQLETALQSVQYAHYTSEPVIRSIWDGLTRLGFNGGKIVEPGAGIGLFAVAAPPSVMAGSSYTGIELDAFSAKIGQYLLPQEHMLAADFIKQKLPDGFFDAAIGNPPFADIKVLDDPAYKKHRFSLHDYFFAKSIDKVRPGGLLVFVTSRYTMDKLNSKARDYIADRADLLGAIRLPQTAFKENAGTEVITDVLFFQRRMPDAAPGGESWLGLKEISVGNEKVFINEFFARHPEMVLGKHATTGSMYRQNEYTVEPTGNIEGQFANAINFLPENLYTEAVTKGVEAAQAKTWEADMRPASDKEGGLYLADGKLFQRDSGVGKPITAFEKITADDQVWLKGYVGLRDALKKAQQDQLKDADWETSHKALVKTYDAFARKHGPILAHTVYERTKIDDDGNEQTVAHRRFKYDRLLGLDIENPLVRSLERITDDGEIVKGAFLLGRTLNKPTRPKIESVQDALAVSLDEIGRLDLNYIASIMKQSREQVIETLGDSIYQSPGGDWQTSDEYLSGDVLAKLEEAQRAADADPAFERNVDALLKVQPKPLSASDISVKLGAGWVPLDIVKKFVGEIAGFDASTMVYEPATAQWAMDMGGSRSGRNAAEEFGTADRSPQEILLAVLNNQTIKVVRKTSDGKSHTDAEATTAANEAAKKLGDRFKEWVWEDGKRAGDLLDLYNRKFNNLAPRRFDGSHLTFPGLSSKWNVHPHVKRAVWRVVQSGNTYLAHAVGAGKTLEMIISGMEQRRLGLIKKPMYVVPNHMLNQFAQEFLEAYPAAQIMVADEKAFHTDNRKRFMAQAALNDPDAIIVTHSSFGKLSTKPESRELIVQGMIEELENAMEESETRYTRSKIEKQIEALKRNFESKTGTGKDQALTFEDMGVDFVYVDEAHEFRKLDYATNRAVKGIDPNGSQRALDLYIKTRWLEQQNPGRSLVMASGTPVTNTMAEIYTVMRYMDEAGLERDGLRAFDAWANMFGEVAAGYEQNAAGGYEIVERFAKFVNVPELMKRVRSFMDVLTSEQLGDLVKRPSVNGRVPTSVVSPPIPTLETYMKGELAQRIEKTRKWKPSREEPANPDPIIAINTDARLASIDMRFIKPGLPNDPGSKLNIMIDKIIETHKRVKSIAYVNPATGAKELIKGGGQIVFSAVGFGEGAMKNRGFDLRAWFDKRLMKEAGLRKSEIGWISDANTHAKKEALQKDVRSGKVKVLVGSPKNMGTGLNVQSRLIALHYLAPPWYPADVEQPHGRIVRQGNRNEAVDLFWYATKGTYDSTAWGMVSRKARFIEQAMSGDDSVRSLDDISEANQYEMAAALAAGDERVIQVAGLSSEIERLSRLQGAHATEQSELRRQARFLTNDSIPYHKKEVADLEAAQKARVTDAPFRVTVGGTTYEKQNEAGDALKAEMLRQIGDGHTIPTVKLGTFQGDHEVGMRPRERGSRGEMELTVKVGPVVIPFTTPTHDIEGMDAGGIGARLANAVARIPAALREAKASLTEAETELKKTDRKLGVPFTGGADLAEKTAERARLQAEMAAETAAAEKADKPAQPSEEGESLYQRGPEIDRRAFIKGATAVAGGFLLGGKVYAQPRGLTSLLDGAHRQAVPLSEALDWIAQHSENINFRRFAARMRPLVNGIVIKGAREGQSQYPDGSIVPGSISNGVAHGMHQADEITDGDVIWLARGEHVDGFNEGTLMHEALHAAIYRVFGRISIRAAHNDPAMLRRHGFNREATPRPASAAHIEELSSIWTDAGVAFENAITSMSPQERDSDRTGAIRNALESPDEMISWALENADVQDFLRTIPARPGTDDGRMSMSLWDRIVSLVRSILNLQLTPVSALDNVLDAAYSMLADPAGPTTERNTLGGSASGHSRLQQTTAITFDDAVTEKRWQDARKGVGTGASIITQGKAVWAAVAAGMTRHWKYLPNSPRFSDLSQQFRKLEAAPEVAREQTVRHLQNVVGKLTAEEYDLFTRKVVLDDLQFEASKDHALPFGLNPQTLKAEMARVDAAFNASPKLVEALRKRLVHNRDLAEEAVAEGVLTREQVENPAYFRHMVLDYARAERQMARGVGSKVMSPWWAKRAGSSLDINANFLEAEADWMLKMRVDLQTAKTIRYIKESEHNLREELRTKARAANKQGIDEAIARDPALAKEEAAFRQRVAMGLDDIRRAVKSGDLDVPAQFQDAADSLSSKAQRDEAIFPFLSWVLENGKPGARGAAMTLKAISQRKAWARDLLGKAYIDTENMQELVKRLAPEGYVGWQPREGRHLFTVKTIPEHVVDRLIAGLADQSAFGISKDEMHRALDTIKPQLVVGGDRYTMVIPQEVADTLDEFGDVHAEGIVSKIFAGVQSAWKRWVLINPRRFLKYNLNNQMGDLDAVIAGHPATLRKVGQAARELFNVMAKGGEPSQTYLDAQERGVFNSGLSFQEIPDINRLSALKHLTSDMRSNRPDKLLARGVGKVWRSLQGSTNFREAVFRYAAYLSLHEKMAAGIPQAKIGYGASVPKLIEAVPDIKDRAALMARDLLGDYGAISVVGQWLRKYMVPFWSWTELNTKRYWRLTANVYRGSKAKGLATGGLLGVGIAGRTAVGLSIRMAFIYTLISLWNHLMFPDEEDKLGESQKRQLHIILGTDADGEVVTLRTQGALSDVLGTFGFEDAMAAFRRASVGQGDYSDMLGAALKAPINRVATSITPIIGEPIEQALGLELWPDAFNPRPIRDRLRHLFSTVSLENEYDVVADRPSRGYWRSWTESAVYRRDPGEMAYDDIRGTAADWLERTRGESGSVNRRNPKSDALRDYRQALRFGDQEAAQDALARYREFDGTSRGLRQSIQRAAPLGMIPKRLRNEFRAQLTEDQRESLHDAEEFYSRVYLDAN